VISQGKLSNLHKIGKYGNETGENRNFHIVSIETASVPEIYNNAIGRAAILHVLTKNSYILLSLHRNNTCFIRDGITDNLFTFVTSKMLVVVFPTGSNCWLGMYILLVDKKNAFETWHSNEPVSYIVYIR